MNGVIFIFFEFDKKKIYKHHWFTKSQIEKMFSGTSFTTGFDKKFGDIFVTKKSEF